MPKQELDPQFLAFAQGLGDGGRTRNTDSSETSWGDQASHRQYSAGHQHPGGASIILLLVSAGPHLRSDCINPLQMYGLPLY